MVVYQVLPAKHRFKEIGKIIIFWNVKLGNIAAAQAKIPKDVIGQAAQFR